MAMSYTTLTGAKTVDGSIRSWLSRATVPSTEVLTEAEAWIYQRLRVREMLFSTTGTLAENADTLALPAGYLETTALTFTNPRGKSNWCTPEVFAREKIVYLADGTKATGWPTWFTDLATQLEFNVKASQAFAYRWMGYAQPTALSASNQTNFLTQRFPTLLRSACLMIACEFERMWEDRDKYRAEAEYWLGEAQAANGLARNHMHRVPVVR